MTDESSAAPFDYDDPVYRAGIDPLSGLDGSILRDEFRDVHPQVADGLMVAGATPVLDMGCGRNVLGKELDARALPWVGVDRSRVQLANGFGARARGDATRLPFRDGVFGSVAALYMLYHLEDPLDGIREAWRVLRAGGVFVACAPSRFNHPELLEYLPPQRIDTYDAEVAPGLVGAVFEDIRVEPWDFHAYRLGDRRMVWNYMVARACDPREAEAASTRVTLPVWVGARGSVVWGRKPGP